MFKPLDWYWLADDGRLFSSHRCALVEATDADFKEWKKAGIAPTRWPIDDAGNQTDASLNAVLQPYNIQIGLPAFKGQIINQINDAAEKRRGKYITPGDGQMMTYLEKINQARACRAAQSPKAVDYPMLAAEIGITAPTLAGVADAVIAAYNQWLVIGSAIEAKRRAANVSVEAATTRAAAQAAFDGLTFPEEVPA